jgi:outer membrane receptor protein involved in Fe transport
MTRFVHTVFLTVSLVIVSVSAAASELAGRVLDTTQAAVPGVRITLIERTTTRQWIGSSETEGQCRFGDLRSGTYLLKAELPGFRTTVVEIVLDDAPRHVEVVLEIGGLSDEIVVTATASPLLSSEVARASTVIDAGEIERRNVPLLGEVLRGLPGVRVQQLGSPGSFTTVRFRGLREADTALLIDGHQIRDAGGFRGDITSFFQQFVLSNLDRIEIVPGASSHLYGSSANGGVINLVPRLGAGPPGADAQFEAGALGLVRASLQSQGRLGERLQYSAGAHRIDVTTGLDDHGIFRNTTLGGLSRFDLSRNIHVSAIAQFSDTPRADLNDSPFPIGPPGNELGFERGLGPVVGFVSDLDDPDARRESRLSTAVVSWSHQLTGHWNYSVSYQRTSTQRNFPDGPALNPRLAGLGVPEFPADLSLIEGRHQAVQTRHDVSIGTRQLVTLGAEYHREARRQQFVSRATNASTGPTSDRQGSSAVFVQDHLSLFDRALNVTVSFRGELFTVENPESVPELRGLETPDAYTGGLAIAYLVGGSGTKIRAQAANGFRAPSLSERFAIFNSSVGPLRVGNPLLRPERTMTVDGGIDQRLFGDRVQLSATYFHNRLQEIITSRRRLFQQANEKGGRTRGVETSVRAVPRAGIELSAGYTHIRADVIPTSDVLRSDNTIARAGVSRPFESTPAHEWYARGAVERGRWGFHTEYAGTSGYQEILFSPRLFRPVLFDFDGYRRLDAIATYRWPAGRRASIDVYVRGQNILDDEYVEDGFRTPGASFWGGIRYRFR